MFVTVHEFDDIKREFRDLIIQKPNVNSVNPEVVRMFAAGSRSFECVKVFMIGYSFWMNAADIDLITKG